MKINIKRFLINVIYVNISVRQRINLEARNLVEVYANKHIHINILQ
jgi:hypothetical protein